MPSGIQITIPSTPAAPALIEPAWNDIVGSAINPFNDMQQTHDWGPGACRISVSLPPMHQAIAGPWIAFLQALQGMTNYFEFSSAFAAAYPDILMTSSPSAQRFWRLTSNERRWTVQGDRYYRITFEAREAL